MSRSPVRLSHSSLLQLDSCPRCFWLRYNRGIYQPQGFASRLPDRFDSIIKTYFDRYRSSGTLPPMLEGKCQGRLEDPFVEEYACKIKNGYLFVGKLDECLVTSGELHTPVDHKTTSADPRNMEIYPAYQAQLDAYTFLLEKNGKKTTRYGHLIFYYPEHTDDLHKGCRLIIDVKTLETDPKRTESAIRKAIEVIESPRPPSPSNECPFCDWYEKVAEAQSGKHGRIQVPDAKDSAVRRRVRSMEGVGRGSEEIAGVRTPIDDLRDGMTGVTVEGHLGCNQTRPMGYADRGGEAGFQDLHLRGLCEDLVQRETAARRVDRRYCIKNKSFFLPPSGMRNNRKETEPNRGERILPCI
jgi:CRISPR/Cas system-associated exonuclease Cas4 (RecB family)